VDRGPPPRTRSIGRLEERPEAREEELERAPTRDLLSMVLEEAGNILKVAQRSKNLYGPFRGSLNSAYTTLRMVAGVMGRRDGNGGVARYTEGLRYDLDCAKKEKKTLKKRVEELEERLSRLEEGRERRTQAPAPPSPAASSLSKRRKAKRAPVTVSSFGEGGTNVGDPGPSGIPKGKPRCCPSRRSRDLPDGRCSEGTS